MGIELIIEANDKSLIPKQATSGSAGFDLRSNISTEIKPRERKLIPTGIRVVIPEGYNGEIRPRSGLANKSGITVLNSPGTIDSDYRGEIKVLLINLSFETYMIDKGDRIAQLVITPILIPHIKEVTKDEFDKIVSKRGESGFGSTGKE